LLPLVVQILNHRDKTKVFSNVKIRSLLAEFGEKIEDVQIRKVVFHIRQRNLIPLLIANSDGYFVATTIQEVETWVQMHSSKVHSMLASLSAIEAQFENEKSLLLNGESSLGGQLSIFDYID
jgi:hypothetical protein